MNNKNKLVSMQVKPYVDIFSNIISDVIYDNGAIYSYMTTPDIYKEVINDVSKNIISKYHGDKKPVITLCIRDGVKICCIRCIEYIRSTYNIKVIRFTSTDTLNEKVISIGDDESLIGVILVGVDGHNDNLYNITMNLVSKSNKYRFANFPIINIFIDDENTPPINDTIKESIDHIKLSTQNIFHSNWIGITYLD